MIIRDDDLDGLVGKGGDFERLIHSLIRAEATACGIAPDQIDWDYRVTVGDGGRDVLIRVGNQRADRLYIPNVQSVWSVKSGNDGLDTGKFSKEICNHPKVISHLESGGDYFSCIAPAADDKKRDALRKTAAALAKKHGFNEKQIHFYFRDNLTSWVNQHLGLIPIHFPHLPKGWMPLVEWGKTEKYLSVPWVDFGARAQLVDAIRTHLKLTSGLNVIHLAGWSGIGKTRTVLQACEDPALEDVLCFSSLEAFTSEFEQHLTRSNEIQAALVIDEFPIEELSSLQSRLADFQNRLRVVTIGAGVKEHIVLRDGVIVVPAPNSTTDVVSVIQSANPSLSTEQAWNIANWSDHDLRLALLLTEVGKNDPTFTQHTFASVDDIWKRILRLFISEITDQNEFAKNYQMLCLSLDIGNKNERREELQAIAQFFSIPISSLDRTIALACQCGLGRQQGRFFEATPRALARRIFERWGWSTIQNDFTKFFSDLPTDRMRRRVIERAQECSQEVRESVAQSLNDWFRSRFPTNDLTLISSREDSRVFCEYAEIAPSSGLAWLRQTVEQATPEQLLAFDGKSDWTGYWRGRRQIVWLCEHLAQFDEYFWDCEAILFRLAQYETETCANNSKGVWQNLFLPELSNTPLPFDERWQYLMKRLSQSTELQLPQLMEAALKSLRQNLEDFITGTGQPEIVGGRSVPPMWHAANPHEREKMASIAASQFIQHAQHLPLEDQAQFKEEIFNNITTFLYLGCLELLRGWLNPEEATEEENRKLRRSLDRYINWLLARIIDQPQWNRISTEDEKEWAKQALDHVKPWRQELNPHSVRELIIDTTARRTNEQVGYAVIENFDVDDLYNKLAEKILEEPTTLNDDLWNWFNSGKPLSAYELGQALGRLDSEDLLQQDILKQLGQGKSVDFVTGYFNAIYWHQKITPPALIETLDSIANDHPETVLYVTLRVDISEVGFQRLLRVTPHTKGATYTHLEALSYGSAWPQLLTDTLKAQIITLLVRIGDTVETEQARAYNLALEMLSTWASVDTTFSPILADVIFLLLKQSLPHQHSSNQAFHWNFLIGRLPASHCVQRIELLIDAIVERTNLREDAIQRLDQIARTSLEDVTRAIEGKISVLNKQDYFLLGDLLSIFDFTNLELMQRLVRTLGVNGARTLAKHLSTPFPTASDPINVPPLTAWLLDEFAEDDQVFDIFCASSLSGRFMVGSWAKYFVGTEEKMKPYLNHPLRRIREWAQNEINYAKGMIEWDNQRESEEGRT